MNNRYLLSGMAAFLVGILALGSLLLGVRFDYTLVTVALGGAVLGVMSGVLGSFAVLRRQSLLGDALSHAALPGVAIAFLVAGRELPALMIGAGISSGLAVLFIAALGQTTRLKQDTAMGISLAAFFAMGIALLSYIQSRGDASQAGLDHFIFGQAAALVRDEVWMMTGLGVIVLGVIALFWKEFKLISFDPAFAQANGYPLRWLDMLLSGLMVVVIVLGLQLAGVILMIGLLIAPAIAARQWTRRLEQMVILAALFGAFAGSGGAILSASQSDMPTGPLMIVLAFAVVVLSLLFAPERGLLWALWRGRAQGHQVYDAQRALHHRSGVGTAPGGLD